MKTSPASPRVGVSTCCSSATPAESTPEAFGGGCRAAVRYGVRWPKHDMMPLVPLMARAAPGVGFGLTMSTTYHHPFHVARLFNALDHVTGGRIAWNAVTSAYKNEAANYGFDTMIPHDERYLRATEHMKIVVDLWDSVEKDAILMDRAGGILADPDKVHLLNHRGKYYNVRGPLPVVPSPQGRPVMIQAGQSGPGMELAARFADMQFVQRRTAASMKEHRATLDAALAAQGRSPRDLGILWLTRVQVAGLEVRSGRQGEGVLDSLPPQAGLLELSTMYGVDFSSFSPSMRMRETEEAVKSQNVAWGSFEELLKTADPDITVEEFGRGYITGRALGGHRHAGGDRRRVRAAALRERCEWRLHPGEGIFGARLSARLRRARGAGTTAPRPGADALPAPDTAGKPMRMTLRARRRYAQRMFTASDTPPQHWACARRHFAVPL